MDVQKQIKYQSKLHDELRLSSHASRVRSSSALLPSHPALKCTLGSVVTAPSAILVFRLTAVLLAACAKQVHIRSKSENQVQSESQERASVPAFVPPGALHLLNENHPEISGRSPEGRGIKRAVLQFSIIKKCAPVAFPPSRRESFIPRPAPIPRPALISQETPIDVISIQRWALALVMSAHPCPHMPMALWASSMCLMHPAISFFFMAAFD